jgi:hypothetical protein
MLPHSSATKLLVRVKIASKAKDEDEKISMMVSVVR